MDSKLIKNLISIFKENYIDGVEYTSTNLEKKCITTKIQEKVFLLMFIL